MKMMEMMLKSSYKLVGNLQVYNHPYASLYLDTELNSLCLFVRNFVENDSNFHFWVTKVSSKDVNLYMNQQETLTGLLQKDKVFNAEIIGKDIYVESKCTHPRQFNLEKTNYFDPEFCFEDFRLRYFLRTKK